MPILESVLYTEKHNRLEVKLSFVKRQASKINHELETFNTFLMSFKSLLIHPYDLLEVCPQSQVF